jgi:hypothetical protein
MAEVKVPLDSAVYLSPQIEPSVSYAQKCLDDIATFRNSHGGKLFIETLERFCAESINHLRELTRSGSTSQEVGGQIDMAAAILEGFGLEKKLSDVIEEASRER